MFKIGQKVRIKNITNPYVSRTGCCFTNAMTEHKNKIATIIHVYNTKNGRYDLDIDPSHCYDPEFFTLIPFTKTLRRKPC